MLRRPGVLLALVSALVLLAASVVTQLAQPQLSGERRVDLAGTLVQGSGSWPSGHATAAMLLALGAILIAGPRLRAVTALAGLGFALAVGPHRGHRQGRGHAPRRGRRRAPACARRGGGCAVLVLLGAGAALALRR